MTWAKLHKEKIDELTNNLSITKYNQLKISTLIKIIEETESHAPQCDQCTNNKEIIEHLILEIPKLNDIDTREPYEKQFNQIRKHFHLQHQFFEPMHHTSRWSLYLLLAGLVVGIALSYFLRGSFVTDFALIGGGIGFVAGYITGHSLDRKKDIVKKFI